VAFSAGSVSFAVTVLSSLDVINVFLADMR
jgi:hypothetical protein